MNEIKLNVKNIKQKIMNIVIIGYRGTGKTSVAKMLAEKLNKNLISTDQRVVEKAKCPITELVEKKGWSYFRQLESKVIDEIQGCHNCVIDTGGGIILHKANREKLRKHGKVILLAASIDEIRKRIVQGDSPPLTKGKTHLEELREVYEQRRKLYEESADYIIDTSHIPIEEVVKRIIRWLKEN